jgi:transposase
MPLRTTDCRLLFGEEHAREIFAICASLRLMAEGDSHGSFVSAVLWTGCTQVVHHRLYLLAQSGKPQKHIRRFGCTTCELRELVAWLQEFGVEHVELLQHGLLRGSFIPPVLIRDLRDLTRARTSLSQEHSRIASRIQKVLEDANIKLASVASNTLGKSGRAILGAMIGGEESSERLADLALGQLRSKIPQLQSALEGRVRGHHRFLLQSLLRQLHFETEIELLDARLDQLRQEHGDLADALNRWITVPGVDRVAAWSFIAEMGTDCSSFPSAAHLASWAGVCPGNNESAGKRISSKIRKGSPWLRRMACQCAWAAARTKNTYLSAQFKRLAARRGRKCAIIAVAHSILVIGYHLQRRSCTYTDLGSNYFDRLHADGLKRYLVKRLESLGLSVTLQPRTA